MPAREFVINTVTRDNNQSAVAEIKHDEASRLINSVLSEAKYEDSIITTSYGLPTI